MKMKKTQKSAKERVMRKLRVIGALQIAAAKAESANSASKASVVQPPIAVVSTMTPTEIPTSAGYHHPEGLLTTIDLESSLPNGFQSKVLRNSSSVYWRTCAASKCNWKNKNFENWDVYFDSNTVP